MIGLICTMKLEGLDKEKVKLGVAVIGTGLIGGLCWWNRKKIMKGLAEFIGTTARAYTDINYDYLPEYTLVKGYWRVDQRGVTFVRPHYRVTRRRRY